MHSFEKIFLLLDQGRFKLAEKELRTIAAADPDNAVLHSLLALSLLGQEKIKDASAESKRALSIDADDAFIYHIESLCRMGLGKYREAQKAVQNALQRDPEEPSYYGTAAKIEGLLKNWKEMLTLADKGLSLNPEHSGCALAKADALVQMNRKDEAAEVIEHVLRGSPENEQALISKGWICLEENNPKKALEFFMEAARIDPESEAAKQGIINALNARHFVFRLILSYYRFMSRLGSKAQWGIIIGLYILFRILKTAAKTYPAITPFVLPLVVVYILFIFLSWTAYPLFNLLLRFNKFGKHALSKEEIMASNLVAASLVAALVSFAGSFLTTSPAGYYGAFGFLFMVIPVSGAFSRSKPGSARILKLYAAALCILLVASMALSITGGAGTALFGIFVLGLFAYTILANVMG